MSLTFNFVNNQIYAIVQPPTPTITSLVLSNGNILIVSWNILSNLATYNLFCSDNTLNVYGITTNSYSVTITPTTSYTFQVVSVINSGVIPVSSDRSNLKTYLSTPGAPSASASGNSITIDLTNSIVKFAISYNLYYSINSGSNQFLTNTSSNTASLSGTVGNSYTFTVVAVASDSTLSLSSSPSQSITVSIIVLSKPSINSTVASGTSITIKWNNVANATSYTLNYNTTIPTVTSGTISGITSTFPGTVVDGTITPGEISYTSQIYTYTITGIAGTTYTFTINANSSSSTSATSDSSTPIAVLDKPIKPATSNVSGSNIILYWTNVKGATSYILNPYIGSTPITAIQFNTPAISSNTRPNSQSASNNGTNIYYNFLGTAGTTYNFEVIAKATSSTSVTSDKLTGVEALTSPAILSSDLILWLDATDINGNNTNPTTNTVINEWVNKAGSTYAYIDLVSEASFRPSNETLVEAPTFKVNIGNNLPGVHFDTNKGLFATIGNNSSFDTPEYLIFIVFNAVSNSQVDTNILGFSKNYVEHIYNNTETIPKNNSNLCLQLNNDRPIMSNIFSIVTNSNPITMGNFTLIILWSDAFYETIEDPTDDGIEIDIITGIEFRSKEKNNFSYNSKAYNYYNNDTTTGFKSFSLGTDSSSDRAGTFFNGSICEIAVYKSFDNNYFNALEKYFKTKWGISY
jgi:hypothetical protein